MDRGIPVLAGAPGSGVMGSCGAAWVRLGCHCHSSGFRDTETEAEICLLGLIGKLLLTPVEARREWD